MHVVWIQFKDIAKDIATILQRETFVASCLSSV